MFRRLFFISQLLILSEYVLIYAYLGRVSLFLATAGLTLLALDVFLVAKMLWFKYKAAGFRNLLTEVQAAQPSDAEWNNGAENGWLSR